MTTLIITESLIAGIATLLGAALVCGLGRPRTKVLAAFMGFAAGIMACVVAVDLLPYSYSFGSLAYTFSGFWLGILFMHLLEHLVNGITKKYLGKSGKPLSRYAQLGILVAMGIALHDLPEGMAIAAGHTAQESTGLLLAVAIGLHNIPEGIAAATPFVIAGTSRWKILFLMLVISLFTPLGAVLGLVLLSLGEGLISLLLALAGGAMISLVLKDMIPEAWQLHRAAAFLGFLAGCGFLLALTFYFHF